MENSLFSLLYYLDISNQILKNNQFRYRPVYLISLLTNSYKDLDDHATSRFHHKVTFETSSDHIN